MVPPELIWTSLVRYEVWYSASLGHDPYNTGIDYYGYQFKHDCAIVQLQLMQPIVSHPKGNHLYFRFSLSSSQ